MIEQITELYREAFQYYDPSRKVPAIHVSYYPYIGINNTIRIRDGEIFIRIGEVCHDMPLVCHKGLAYILVGKLFRRKIPKGANEVYSAYIKSEPIRQRADEHRRQHGRKVVTTTKGSVYDLDEIFDDLNRKYFHDAIPKPTLTWSAAKTYRILGHHDSTHDHITISTSLDTPKTPRYVVEYVVFHEMLHIFHPTRHVNGRRYSHTVAFKRDEQKFAYYEESERWIERNVGKMKRAAKRSK